MPVQESVSRYPNKNTDQSDDLNIAEQNFRSIIFVRIKLYKYVFSDLEIATNKTKKKISVSRG